MQLRRLCHELPLPFRREKRGDLISLQNKAIPCKRDSLSDSPSITLFLLTQKGQKKKLCKKKIPKKAFRSLRRATKAPPLESASFLKKA
jgi:hypothetical protein